MRFLILFLLIGSATAMAQLYRSEGIAGETVFSDRPLDSHAQSVELPPINLTTVTLPTAAATGETAPGTETVGSSIDLHVIGLANDQAVRANNGNLAFEVSVAPPMTMEQRLQPLLDNRPYGPSSASTHFLLQSLDRGTHTLAVQLLEGERTIRTSDPITFHLLRTHR